MKFVSWNVNGLRACAGKGFADAFNSLDADFFCLQETKMQPGQLDMEFEGYKSYWNSAEKKGYSGTMIAINTAKAIKALRQLWCMRIATGSRYPISASRA